MRLEKLSSPPLTYDGENYLIWALDVKQHLHACNLGKEIEDPFLEIPNDLYDAQALVFMQHQLMFCGCYFKISSITNTQYFCQRLVMIGYIFEFKIMQP